MPVYDVRLARLGGGRLAGRCDEKPMTDTTENPPTPADASAADAAQRAQSQPMPPWAAPVALLAITLLAYIPAMRGGFIWDDDYYVTLNRSLRSFDGIQQIWTGIFPNPREYPRFAGPQYYPMTYTSFWLQTRFQNWSQPLSPFPFHLVSVLLHGASAVMLWVILRKLAVPGPWVIAAIFALHPVQVESVAWITERKNVLSGAFYFASLLVYLRFAGLDPAPPFDPEQKFALPRERGKVYSLALVLFACALLSKTVTGSLPAVVLLLIWWKRGRIRLKEDVLPLLPFF